MCKLYLLLVMFTGAHTLGLAHGRDGSGFRFAWVERQKTFNNQYYTDMLDGGLNWVMTNVAGPRRPKWQWVSGGERRVCKAMVMLVMVYALLMTNFHGAK